MPIRINLLAEAQAAEEIRRRDPVKRATWVGGLIVALVLFGSCLLQAKIIAKNSTLSALEGKRNFGTNLHNKILTDRKKLMEVKSKLAALNTFSSNRFLQATVLDAFQQATIEGIQVTKLRTAQSVDLIPETKPTTTESGKTIPGKPGVATEKISLIIDARDSSTNPGTEQISQFKEALARTRYFQCEGITTNMIRLKNRALPQFDPESGKPSVQFILQCDYPERVR